MLCVLFAAYFIQCKETVADTQNLLFQFSSESSMFVFPHKIVLKTCGTTTLLKAVPYILEIAKTRCGYESVYRLFYSRKSFMFPEKQLGPHRSWEEEVNYLDNHFGKCFGKRGGGVK